jgi:quercetin dioxygenase-like cupin family protein
MPAGAARPGQHLTPAQNRIMVMKIAAFCLWIALSTAGFSQAPALAAKAEKVQFQGGKVIVSPGARTLAAPEEVTLPFNIVVLTNGTFTVKGGQPRTLQEGDSLDSDGMLSRADGTISPVIDHVSRQRGRVTVLKDGQASQPSETLKLTDGTTISPEGKITTPNGSSRVLLDGEIFKLEGGAVAARDTITKQNGRVKVQKDGSTVAVEPGRSIMMNDGTKVLSDGTVIRTNGDQITLTEGQVITIDGVVTRSR